MNTNPQIDLPLLDEAATALRQTGHHESRLTGPQLAQILASIVRQFLAGQNMIRVADPEMSVVIQNSRGVGSGTVIVQSPISATIRVRTVLANAAEPSRIRLEDLNVQQEAGFAAKIALRAFDVEKLARNALSDPNRAMELALTDQLATRGARLTTVGLAFQGDALAVALRGERM